MPVITNFEGTQFQQSGASIATSPEILNYNSADFEVSIDPTDSTKVIIASSHRHHLMAYVQAISSGTVFYFPFFSALKKSATITAIRTFPNVHARLYDLRIGCVALSGSNTCEFMLMKNDEPTTLTKTLPMSGAWSTDVDDVNTVDIISTDWISMRVSPSGATLQRASVTLTYKLLYT